MERIERKEYRVLVAVANPETLETLLEVGMAVARRHDGELVLVSVAEVPDGETLMAGRSQARSLEPLLARAVGYANQRGVSSYSVIKIARRASHAIVETAREEECNFIVIGQPVRQSFFERMVTTVVERVLQNAPSQVAIVYGHLPPGGITGIVVPTTKGPNTKLAAELAPAFRQGNGLPARAVTVVGFDESKAATEKRVAEARETLESAGFAGDFTVLRRDEIVEALSQAVSEGELVLMGAPASAPVAAIFGETIPAALARQGRHPVVVVRDVEPQQARRFERWFFREE